MPFALLTIGLALTIAAVRGEEKALLTLVQGDFTGPNNFLYWFMAIVIVGAIGYIPNLRVASNMFLALILIGLLLHEKGFFNQFQNAIAATQAAQPVSQARQVANADSAASTLQKASLLQPIAELSGITGV